MPFYKYVVRTDQAQTIKGRIEANSPHQAASLLKEKNLFIISLSQSSNSILNDLSLSMDRVKAADLVNFTRQLSTMITSGLTLTESFGILVQQSRPAMQRVVLSLSHDVEGGTSFGNALEKHRGIFSKVYIALVRSGEAAGMLDQVLHRLADNMEKSFEFRAKTKGALIYPAIVFVGMIIVAFLMMVMVIPKLTTMYEGFNAELPLPTKILISTSNFMATNWYFFVGAVIGGVYIFRLWKTTPTGEFIVDKLLLKIPVFGRIRVLSMMTEFTRTISLLLGAGVSLLSTLQIVAESMDNVLFRDALHEVATDVEKGVPLSESLTKSELFPPLVSQMSAVGEETGKLDEVLLKVSAYFESESEHMVKNLSTLLEPIIMVILGVGVMFLILAIIMPIYNLTSQF